jgi:integrase
MQFNGRPLPLDDDVRTLLAASRADKDPRTSAAISLLLSHSVTPTELGRLRWNDVDLAAGSIRLIRTDGRAERVDIGDFVIRQLVAVRQTAEDPKVFANPSGMSLPLSALFKALLGRTQLSKYVIQDFVLWSLHQTAAVRKSVSYV